ncbi:MAG: cation-translocating P-type ATPase [Flavobacteriales bacterium]|nr:cation-translocating P-type ATPase [Flavobacteriales bacterium]MEB2341523.1 cation-translocating P-type ATPase [Flavobacteriia bacterium]
MAGNPFPFQGLNDAEVARSRATHGGNALENHKEHGLWAAVREAVTEPMFLLLLAAACIYFILGDWAEAWFMTGAILLVGGISLYQDQRSRRALEELEEFTAPKARAIRNNEVTELHADELVVGDHVVVNEGEMVPADGLVVHANDFAVNESILTGEAFPVGKAVTGGREGMAFRGTQAVDGLAVIRITAVGKDTQLGRIGGTLAGMGQQRAPLEHQIHRFVRAMAIIGAVFFLLVWGLNFIHSHSWMDSLLKGLTLAMSILPEEIPVAFTTFMALGAWRMGRMGLLVKQARTVETLGGATVICTDKTGTITQNRMELVAMHVAGEPEARRAGQWDDQAAHHLLATAMWASEPVPFNPMETSLHAAYGKYLPVDERPDFRMVHEYPLSGRPPMMTHVFANAGGRRIIAAKGAPEAILAVCRLDAEERRAEMAKVEQLAAQGMRLLAVAEARPDGAPWPATQQEIRFSYLGLVAFHDPPKENIPAVLRSFREAGIRTLIITGDNAATTAAIAKAIGFRLEGPMVDGEAVQAMDDAALARTVHASNCFTRMFPDAKVRVVKALQADGQVVAMTGDGVNDGPALKAADIGIAMGKRGTALAKEAADLILLDDDLGRMTDAIAQGRRIYANLKKAIQYIISIHIPIILTVSLPLLLGWIYPNIFTPVHVIFLELLMGPTCSIAYESEPMEPGTMRHPPRKTGLTFLSWAELRTSLLQGLVITVGTLFCYRFAVWNGLDEAGTRTLVFTSLVVANIALTLVNRSFEHSVWSTLRYPNALLRGILLATVALLALLLYMPLLRDFFRLATPPPALLAVAIAAGLASVLWFEAVKAWRRKQSPSAIAGA